MEIDFDKGKEKEIMDNLSNLVNEFNTLTMDLQKYHDSANDNISNAIVQYIKRMECQINDRMDSIEARISAIAEDMYGHGK